MFVLIWKQVENEKGFRVLKIDRTELLSKTARFGAVGVCDRCGHTPHTAIMSPY